MAENTKIQWCSHTFNPWIGCAKVSEGCQNCYAENLMATRYHRVVWGHDGTRSRTKTWGDPKRGQIFDYAEGESIDSFFRDMTEHWMPNYWGTPDHLYTISTNPSKNAGAVQRGAAYMPAWMSPALRLPASWDSRLATFGPCTRKVCPIGLREISHG